MKTQAKVDQKEGKPPQALKELLPSKKITGVDRIRLELSESCAKDIETIKDMPKEPKGKPEWSKKYTGIERLKKLSVIEKIREDLSESTAKDIEENNDKPKRNYRSRDSGEPKRKYKKRTNIFD